MASPLIQLPPELARLCATPSEQPADALPLGLSGLDEALPDGGLPRGSVIELGSPAGLAQATRLALAACAAAQSHSRQRRRDGRSSWCAWIDPFSSLYAPGVAAAGVDLDRLLVARPPIDELARIAVRVVASGIFSVVVVDRSGVDGAALQGRSAGSPARNNQTRSKTPWRTVTRRLALAADTSRTTVLLLSSARAARRDRLPTALRLELGRPQLDTLSLRVAKERRGRTREARLLSLRPSTAAAHPHEAAAPQLSKTSPQRSHHAAALHHASLSNTNLSSTSLSSANLSRAGA